MQAENMKESRLALAFLTNFPLKRKKGRVRIIFLLLTRLFCELLNFYYFASLKALETASMIPLLELVAPETASTSAVWFLMISSTTPFSAAS